MSKIVFAVGTGRCGTKFLQSLLANEPQVASSHEKHPVADTFHRFCKWYDLPVDHEGFLSIKRQSIANDLAQKQVSFEASAFVSLSIQELWRAFDAKFILLVREPAKVVNSYFVKGWYKDDFQLKEYDKIPTFQEGQQVHHFLGRTIPRGEEFARWNRLSRIGKLAWFWNTLNKQVLKQFEALPETNRLVLRLEDFTFQEYQRIATFIGITPKLTDGKFKSIVKSKPNAFEEVRTTDSWSEVERREFCEEAMEMANRFEYNI